MRTRPLEPPPKPPTAGEIRPEAVYTLPEFMARTRMSKAAVRSARRRGLKVKYSGRNAYVAGADFIAYLDATAADSR